MSAKNIYPVVLAGGSGTRLWPMSREGYPKQFLPLLGGHSPFQATLLRVKGMPQAQAPIVITNREHKFLVLDQAKASQAALGRLFLEPSGRSTAPAAAMVAIELLKNDPDALMLVMAADHDIPDPEAFRASVLTGAEAAAQGRFVVFGIEARWPETGYGYIERGEALDMPGCHHVQSFIEKPELEIAQGLVASGRHYWNSGIFLFGAAHFLAELARYEPELEAACRAAAATAVDDHGSICFDAAAYQACRSVSIDYAVAEHTTTAAVVPASFDWSDIGSWNTLWDRSDKDAVGNVVKGDVYVDGSENCYITSNKRMVAAIGLKDVVIVETPDAILVADRKEAGRVRGAVEQLKSKGRPEGTIHRTVHRPWGCYEDIDSGDRFRVKRITVNPGSKLSLQLHHHRAEHWIVVKGTALVTRGEESILLAENQSTYIPLGVRHRLENPGKIPLQLIEVQSGAYLEEDDIVRLEDTYHRV
jgi:mannose-1-phosphate guanylyltransferase / mannose-6-phosphate isomerase